MFFNKKNKTTPGPLPPQQPMSRPTGPSEPSYIGRDTVIDGHITCDDEMHIDGSVRGSVRARICVIDQNGSVDGDVAGDVVHVRGRIIGPIQGSKVYIHAGAHVEGDVFQDTISIENGAYVYGTIRHNVPPPSSVPAFPVQSLGHSTFQEKPAAEPVLLDPLNLRIVKAPE